MRHVLASVVIDRFKDKEWTVWLEARSFRKESPDCPHLGREFMLARLSNAIEGMEK